MHEAQTINQISQYFLQGRYKEALSLCAEISTTSRNSKVFYLYGLCCYKNLDLTGACLQFHKAVELNPHDYDSAFNLAIAYSETGQYVSALDTYRDLLSNAPHYIKALPNLAQLLMKTGNYEEGCKFFIKALAVNPQDTHSAGLFMEFECLYRRMKDRAPACNSLLSLPGISPTHRHTALIYRATAEWVTSDSAALEKSLADACRIPMQANDQGYTNMAIYRTFLQRLFDYRKAHPHIYQPDSPPLYMVGDSHSLSYANTTVSWKGRMHKVESHLIIGLQARHLSPAAPDAKKYALAHYIKTLPPACTLFCTFGEIDCRLNHGILPYWQKQGGALEDITSSIVTDYCQSLMNMAEAANINLVFLSVPAPQVNSGDRRQVIRLFNSELRKRVTSTRHIYIDTHAPSQGTDGYAHGQLHIDNFHLKPEALQTILS